MLCLQDGWTPLIAASYCGELDMVKLMIKLGADVKASCKVSSGWDLGACMHASRPCRGLTPRMRPLPMQDGDTALHYASAQGHMDIIQLLAKSGARLDAKDRDGETPYNVAGKNMKVRPAKRSCFLPFSLSLSLTLSDPCISSRCALTKVRKLIQELMSANLNDDKDDKDEEDGDEEEEGWEEVEGEEAAAS